MPANSDSSDIAGFHANDLVEAFAAELPSAGWNTTALGKAAMKGLVGMKAAAALMDASSAQAKKMLQITEVANVRAKEAQRMVLALEKFGAQDPSNLFYQLADGPGFGNPDAETEMEKDGGDLPGGLPGPPPVPGMPPIGEEPLPHKFGKRVKPKIPPMPKKDAETVDMEGYHIINQLRDLVRFTTVDTKDAPAIFRDSAHGARRCNIAWRSAADLLKYPGQPVDPLPDLIRRPRPSRRPSDLAPAWMDFLYATTAGSDPYAKWPHEKRKNIDSVVEGEEVHNIFGSPPLKPPWNPWDSLNPSKFGKAAKKEISDQIELL
eukprot:TRINITY_DN19841_c0_g1_i1.p2 TRINITY_DN19841_c0_g1~~TRINITY_DN19841_c0_g1_i1.p2  ORF type:complete len:320 (-),score=91.51 TRINITY_DN19841_c0_g1_i1:75-1034(-)